MTFGQIAQIKGGEISGSGTITGDVLNSGGIVSPGPSPGMITINGDYTQLADATLSIQIAGLLPGEFDVLSIMGDAILGGTLDLSFIDGFVPEIGDIFDILTVGGAFSGGFDNINILGLEPGWRFDTSFISNARVFRLRSLSNGLASIPTTSVPEPGGMLPTGLILLIALQGLRRRRERGHS